MESSSSTPLAAPGPGTPSHAGLLPSLSPSATHSEQAPAPAQPYGGYMAQPTSATSSAAGTLQDQGQGQGQGQGGMMYHPHPHAHQPQHAHGAMMYVSHPQSQTGYAPPPHVQQAPPHQHPQQQQHQHQHQQLQHPPAPAHQHMPAQSHPYQPQQPHPGHQHPHQQQHPHPHSHSMSHSSSMGPPGGPGGSGMPPPHFQPVLQHPPPTSTQTPARKQSGPGGKKQAQTPRNGAGTAAGNGGSTTPLSQHGMQTPTLANVTAVPGHGQSHSYDGGNTGAGTPGQASQAGVFGAVMQQPAGNAKVYASVYSGIPVFEAMIRGISVMRRTSDSWVNATQILKVAGIPKSARTKILEKEILAGVHEKVQGGYGKYQGTWIPLERGNELAAQYGVTTFLSPIFDFVPSPANVAALPVAKGDGGKAAAAAANLAGLETPDRPQKTPGAVLNYSAIGSLNNGRTPTPASRVYAPSPAHGQTHSQSPMPHTLAHAGHETPLQPPPSFLAGEGMMMAAHPAYGGMYYTGPGHAASMQPARASGMGHPAGSELAPAAELNGYGLPHGQSDVYIDAYGQAHSAHFSMPMAPDAAAGLGGGMSEPPMKRFKADPYEDAVIADEEGQDGSPADTGDESDSDEPNVRNGQPVPTAMRLSTKPIRPKPGTAGKARSRLMALFNEDVQDVRTFLGLPSVAEKAAAKDRKAAAGNSGDISMDGSAVNDSKLEAADREGSIEDELDFDVDAIIDDQGHTALHWAASLARMSLVEQLIELGADIERGNYAGETPLIRAVLTTNHVESGTFTALLGHLSPSIRTIDHAYRTVVHHIALVAGVKGRAAAARSYMAAILGWTAKEMKEHQTHAQNGLGNVLGQGQGQAFGPGPNGTNGAMNGHSGTNGISSQGSDGAMATLTLKTLVDVQDVHGDTALNVAARVGNKGLVGLLLDAGADKARANKLGLKPVDFGVETEALKVAPGEAVVADIKAEVPRPVRQSRDVQKNIATIFESINEAFDTEMMAKQSKLNTVEQNVRSATKALAEKRQAVSRAQATVGEAQLLHQKIDNVRSALAAAEDMAWADLAGPSSSPNKHFHTSPSASTLTLPEQGSEGAVLRLRRMLAWEEQMASAITERTSSLRDRGMDGAVKYRKLVSLCTRTPVDQVDGMLDGLVAAVESDRNVLDFSRISDIMLRHKAAAQGQGQGQVSTKVGGR